MYKLSALLPKTAGQDPEYGPLRRIRTEKGKLIRDLTAAVDEWPADEIANGFVSAALNLPSAMINQASASALPEKSDVIWACCRTDRGSIEDTVLPAHPGCRRSIIDSVLNCLAEVIGWENQR